jgi:hypothetical protein
MPGANILHIHIQLRNHPAVYGWARLLLDRTWDLIIDGTAHRGASGVAMPTDEDGQYDHFLFNHPERGDSFAAA